MQAAASPTSAAATLRRAVRRPGVAAACLFALVLLIAELFPKSLPLGVRATGLIFGARGAFVVAGIVLTYRSSRLVNFAQVQLGAVGAVLFYGIVREHSLLRALDYMGLDMEPAPRWAVHLEYWGAAVVAVAVSALIGALVYGFIIRRFANQPPLVGTVATIALASLLAALADDGVLRIFGDKRGQGVVAVPPPITASIRIAPATFHLAEILTVIFAVVALCAIAWFLLRTRTGIAVRASAENQERASTLGVNTAVVGGTVWTIAGLLSGLAGVLLVMAEGGGASGGGTAALVRSLGAVVLAGMTSLPLAVAGVVTFALLDQAFLWAFGNAILVDLVAVSMILAFLLLVPRPRLGRADAEGSWRAAREIRPIPDELRDLPAVRRLRRRTFGVVAVLVLGFPFVANPTDTGNGAQAVIYAIVGLSLLLLTGWAGLISLGQFALAAIGAFTVALAAGRWGLPFLLTLPLAAIVGAVAAILIGIPALRIRGLYLAITTLGLALVTANVLLAQRYGGRLIPATLDRPSVFGLDTTDERAFYYLCLAVLILATLAVVGIRRSRTGRALIASRDNERTAQSYSINIVRARLETFAVSGMLAAIAGGLFAYQQGGVAVGNFSPDVSLIMFLMVVIGGLGAIYGPLLGAFVVGVLAAKLGGASGWMTAAAVLGLLLLVPGGLAQIVANGRDALLRRIAVRNRIHVPSLLADGAPSVFDEKAPIVAKSTSTGSAAFVPRRYRLDRRELEVPKVAATGKGAR